MSTRSVYEVLNAAAQERGYRDWSEMNGRGATPAESWEELGRKHGALPGMVAREEYDDVVRRCQSLTGRLRQCTPAREGA